MPEIGPAPVLALLAGTFHTALFALIRDSRERLLLSFVAAVLGALAGDALGGRVGGDPLRIGDFNLLWASAFAWIGLLLVWLVAQLGPERRVR